MDSDVCPICRELDGTVVPAESSIRYKYNPPLHYHCRCLWLPITLDEVEDPEISGTDLTLGDKGKPLTLDEMIALIGNKSEYKKFTEDLKEPVVSKKENKKLEKVVSKLSDQVKGMNKQYEKLSSKMDKSKNPVNNITIPLDLNVSIPKDKNEKRTVSIKRDPEGKITMAEITEGEE
jgi:hypothetical protein